MLDKVCTWGCQKFIDHGWVPRHPSTCWQPRYMKHMDTVSVHHYAGHSWPKGSVVPICGMSPRQPLCQGSHMWALPDGECLMRAVDNVSKHCSGFSQISEVLGNPHHVLHHLLSPVRHNIHNMRQHSHNRIIPLIKAILLKRLSLTAWYWKTVTNASIYILTLFYFLYVVMFTALRCVIGSSNKRITYLLII